MPRALPRRAISLVALAALVFTATAAHALQVTGIDVDNKRGQSFISWNNLPGTGWTYHVYASYSPIRTSADLFTNAWELGSVGDSSAVDRRISTLLGTTLTFCTDSGGTPLNARRGLFVMTPVEQGLMHYAILSESETYPLDYHFFPGQNTTEHPVVEVVQAPRPIWQRSITTPACEDYVLFANAGDVAGMPSLWATENHALHFGVKRGRPGGALLLHGHGRGGSFLNSIVGTGRSDETVIAPDDHLPTWDVASFYLGYNNTYDPNTGKNHVASGGTVVDYTDRFVMYLLDWGLANGGSDPNRVYALGSSMGGSFAFFAAWHHADRIAAAISIMPKTIANHTADTSPTIIATFERMWSPIPLDLPTIHGIPVYQWMDGRFLSQHFARRGSAPVLGFAGRNDDMVGWQEKVLLLEALDQNRAGGEWYWDERTHFDGSGQVEWAPVQNDWARLYRFRLDRSYPALSNCSADSDPGDGTAASGDAVGTVNGFVTWDEVPVDTRDRWECVLRVRDAETRGGALPAPAGLTVDVTPRRLQEFVVTDRTGYTFAATDATTGALLASGPVQADANYLLTVPAVPVGPGGTRLTLQPLTSLSAGDGRAPRAPRFALGANPLRGSTSVQVDWPSEGPARVDLLDPAGRRVRTLHDAPARGTNAFALDAAGLAPGVYMLHARQGVLSSSTRIVVVR